MLATSRDRRVRHFRLLCEREEQARRGQTLLEDALRTASLGDEGRLIVVRSLALGRLSTHASSTAWSLRLEQRLQTARSQAVFAGSSGADDADVVWFPNEIEVWTALASRAASGTPCREWFWKSAARGWTPHFTPEETLRLAFRSLAALGGLPATVPLARRLVREGNLPALMVALSAEDARPVLRDLAAAGAKSSKSLPVLPAAPQTILRKFIAEHPAISSGDPRLIWLVMALLASENAALPIIEEVRRIVAALRADPSRHPAEIRSPAAVIEPVVPPSQGKLPLDRVNSPDQTSSAPWEATTAAQPRRTIGDPVETPAHVPEAVATACGGLFFLIPLFTALGIDDLPHPGTAAWLALRLVLARCRPRPTDGLLDLLPTPEPAPTAAWVLPNLRRVASRGPSHLARWRTDWRILLDGTRRLPLAVWPCGKIPPLAHESFGAIPVHRTPDLPLTLDPSAVALALGAHRLCRRRCGLGLKTLVRRPARISITETHVDVFLRSTQADPRVRRAALDLDPGWVPWLGRVVTFHYLADD